MCVVGGRSSDCAILRAFFLAPIPPRACAGVGFNAVTHNNSLNLLVIEDEEFVFEAVATMASRLHHRIFRAHDAEAAVVAMNAWGAHIQAVLLNWSLPFTLCGGELVDSIHKINPRMPIVILSVMPAEEVRVRLPKGSPAIILQKPFLHFELESTIRTAAQPAA